MDVANAVRTLSYTMLTGLGAIQNVLCRQDSTLKPLVVSLYIVVCPVICLRASSRCKHDMGAHSYLNAETFERASTPLFGRLVRCSAHVSLSLWYYEMLKPQVVHVKLF